MDLEVRLGDDRRPVGNAQDCPIKIADMKAALRTVAELVAAGLFSLRHEALWQFEIQFLSQAAWAEFGNKPTCGGIESDPESLDAALSRPDGRIILTEENLALVYTRQP